MPDLRGLVRRGLNRPEKIPRYVLGFLHPSSRIGPTWRIDDGAVVFEPGGYVSSPRTRPEFAANCYHEISGLRDVLSTHLEGAANRPLEGAADRPLEGAADRSLEVGCGYGRLSPWIAEHADAHWGLDPDADALATLARQYPWIDVAVGRAEAAPFPADAFDLIVTWTVLQHVDGERIDAAATELARLLEPGGLLVCCERVRGRADHHLHPRSVDRYRRLFDPLELVDDRERPVEPTWPEAMGSARPPERLLVFRAPG